jgi:hypothetical protein
MIRRLGDFPIRNVWKFSILKNLDFIVLSNAKIITDHS